MPTRIKNFVNTAATIASDDYLPLDGTTNGTRKMLGTVAGTQIGLQLASDGMIFGAGSAASPKLAIGTAGNGIYAPAANVLGLASAGVLRITVGASGLNGVGVATPVTEWHVGTSLTSSPRGIMSAQYNTGTDGARFHMRKARGTEAAPTTVVTGDVLGKLVATGYDGSNHLEVGAISIEATGTIAATRVPTRIVFSTATDAAPSVLTDRMWLTQAGALGVGTSVPGAFAAAFNHPTGQGIDIIYNDSDGSPANHVSLTVNSLGDFLINPSSTLTIFTSSGVLGWNGRSKISSPSSGVITLLDNGSTDFNRLQYGGTTASYVSTKRVGTTLAIRLADDSSDAPITASNGTFSGYMVGGVQSLSGAGAVNVTQAITEVTSTGVGDALTLANGVAGQEKTIVHGVDGGSFVLTPTTKTGWSTFTSTAAGESITLVYLTTRGWVVKGSYLGVIAP